MTISTNARAAVYAQETSEVFLVLLTINHPDFTIPIRVVNNTENIDSNGVSYVAFPFDIVLPDEEDGRDIIAKLTIDNVSREIAQAIRTITEPPTVDISVIRASAPDDIEIAMPTFTLRNVVYDALTVAGDLLLNDITQEPYPQYDFSPTYFPGLV